MSEAIRVTILTIRVELLIVCVDNAATPSKTPPPIPRPAPNGEVVFGTGVKSSTKAPSSREGAFATEKLSKKEGNDYNLSYLYVK